MWQNCDFGRGEEAPLAAEQVVSVVRQIRSETLGYTARASRQPMISNRCFALLEFAAGARKIGAADHLTCANQTTVGLSFQAGDQVQRVVHSVGEIAVDVAGRTKHRLVSVRLATIGVRPRVAFARVRLNLGNQDRHGTFVYRASQDTAEECWRDLEYIAGEEAAARWLQTLGLTHQTIVCA